MKTTRAGKYVQLFDTAFKRRRNCCLNRLTVSTRALPPAITVSKATLPMATLGGTGQYPSWSLAAVTFKPHVQRYNNNQARSIHNNLLSLKQPQNYMFSTARFGEMKGLWLSTRANFAREQKRKMRGFQAVEDAYRNISGVIATVMATLIPMNAVQCEPQQNPRQP